MYNNEILKTLVQEFGPIQAYLFCRMEARKYELTTLSSNNMDDCYDYYWWKNACEELNEKIKNVKHENA